MNMNELWARKLTENNSIYTWDQVPPLRKNAVKIILQSKVESGDLTQEKLDKILNPTA